MFPSPPEHFLGKTASGLPLKTSFRCNLHQFVSKTKDKTKEFQKILNLGFGKVSVFRTCYTHCGYGLSDSKLHRMYWFSNISISLLCSFTFPSLPFLNCWNRDYGEQPRRGFAREVFSSAQKHFSWAFWPNFMLALKSDVSWLSVAGTLTVTLCIQPLAGLAYTHKGG